MKKTIRFVAFAMVFFMLCLALASCGGPNADPIKALDALKENGVDWAIKDDIALPITLKAFGVDGVDCVVSGTGKIDEEYAHITIIYFEEAEDADAEWEDVSKYADKEKENINEADWVLKKSGKMIYFGTKNAIAAAK